MVPATTGPGGPSVTRNRVRAGWTVPVIGAGVVLGIGGLVVRHNAAPLRAFCQLRAQLAAFDGALTKSTGPLPEFKPPPALPGCTAINLRYDLGLVTALVALVVTAVGLLFLMVRSRNAAAAGSAWPVRRRMDAAAAWLDARLPGRRPGSPPRLRGGFLAVLSLVLLVVAGAGGASLWNSYKRSEQIQTYETANALLAAIKLPPGMKHAPGVCQFTVCATSSQSPAQIEPFLRRVLHGGPIPALSNLLACPLNACPVTIYGQFHGTLAFGDALRNLIVVRNGKPPKGAIPVHPNLHAHRGQPVGYWFGSQVTIDAIDPRQPD